MNQLTTSTTSKSLLALCIFMIMAQNAHADTPADNRPLTVVLPPAIIHQPSLPRLQFADSKITRDNLNNQLINDAYDLVRYDSDVSVAQLGRFGNQGFAIRGVEGNRVNLNLDGVNLPESESNEIFSRYGYMPEGRIIPEMELMDQVLIHAGADSTAVGSGALGGSVSFKSKEPTSLVKDTQGFGGYAKIGYSNKNEEKMAAVGMAAVGTKAEFLLNYTRREGSETKNHAMRPKDKAKLDPNYVFSRDEMPNLITASSLIYPNPQSYTQDGLTAKLYIKSNKHRFGIHGLYQEKQSLTNADSMHNPPISPNRRLANDARRTHDTSRLATYGLSYRYQPTTTLIDSIGINLNQSRALTLADTWLYDRVFDGETLKSSQLYRREYRPTNTVTKQADLIIKTNPITLGKAGTHNLSFGTQYSRQNYDLATVQLGKTASMDRAFVDSKKQDLSFYLHDNIEINDRLRANIGVRYTDYQSKPYFQSNVFGNDENAINAELCDEYNEGSFCQLYRQGNNLPKARFTKTTYSGGIDYDLIPNRAKVGYKIATGFLAPTTTQLYANQEVSYFDIRQLANPELKPETSLSQEFSVQVKPLSNIRLTATAYQNNYKNFIQTKWGDDLAGCGGSYCSQSVNLNDAKVTGFKLGVDADLSNLLNTNGRLLAFANYHQAKDRASFDGNNGKLTINTLSTAPATLIMGASYTASDDSWQLHGVVNAIAAKKAKDAQVIRQGRTATGRSYEYSGAYEHINRSKNALIYDLYGSKKLGKNLSLTAGVYNITNVRYIPWENLKQFVDGEAGNSMVDDKGYGFARYTATGRNYAAALTYTF
ncbi:TonB-dependent hemoglobin/transferrin/lactoferrin family receptor [Moraxella cuniculi]|uniref:Probable hemoglobin and hemoglobin-haptoglobin-binding protein 2 n=1 Tax=Moraxella cuniculi TaxID=34061 RepID=A0A448GZ92_9GAMM|nr:TonB-dependent hemoglobin/transferrin/lactoferrin family receptor [Moraxella cuniculi]VEG14029.1 Probable hemoglobin and hemoglobin-haptoglobin-binding protein 2 precursor [Moraxella cuniculi]